MASENELTIFRNPTQQEREDFVVLNEDTPQKELTKIRCNIFHKMITRNRSLILKSENPIDLKDLSCPGCFVAEFQHNLVGDDFEVNFKRYQGRLKLKEVRKTAHQHGLYREEGIAIFAETCAYCGRNHSFSFQKEELNNEQWKLLVMARNKISGEE